MTSQMRADLILAIDAATDWFKKFPVDPKFVILVKDEQDYVLRLQTIRNDLVSEVTP